MTRNNTIMLLIILAIFGFTAWIIVPLLSSVELVYQPQFSENMTAAEKQQAVYNALATIKDKVAEASLAEAEVAMRGEEGIVVKIPDASDELAMYNLIGYVEHYQLEEAIVHGERFGRKGLHLGLDLVGGVRLVYEVDFADNATQREKTNAMDRTITIIQNRIDKYGVTEPKIEQMGDERIEIQLPGFTDEEAAKALVEQTGYLDFRETELNAASTAVRLQDYLSQETLAFIDADEPGDRLFPWPTVDDDGESAWMTAAILTTDGSGNLLFTDAAGEPVHKEQLSAYAGAFAWVPARGNNGTHLTGDLLDDAQPMVDNSESIPKYAVDIQWNAEGTVYFDDIAARIYPRPYNQQTQGVEKSLGIFLDGVMISYPTVNSAHFGGSGTISGRFSPQEAEELANLLKSGSLPMPLKQPPLFEQKVSATLGSNFIDMSWRAGIIGIALVMLFMIVYYRTAGFLASLALLFYGVLVLAIFKLWPVTLSLAGMGGFIVSLGMAVDANVLIFERFKEELRKGRTMGAAVEEGFSRAWTAILDSNVTTIIACIILIWLASSVIASAQVMGFAVTLLIGVVISMFTAMVVTRTLLRLFIHTRLGKSQRLFLMDWGK